MADAITYDPISRLLNPKNQASIFREYKWEQKYPSALITAQNGINIPFAHAIKLTGQHQIVEGLQANMSHDARMGVMTSYLVQPELEEISFGNDSRLTTPLIRELLLLKQEQWRHLDPQLVKNFVENPYGQGGAALAQFVTDNHIGRMDTNRLFEALHNTRYVPNGGNIISQMYAN